MLAIHRSDLKNERCTPNILPCRIHYTGPTKVTKRHWSPSKNDGGQNTVFFRGRKLLGRTVKLPDDYQGLILKTTDRTINHPPPRVNISRHGDLDDVDEEDSEVQVDISEAVKILDCSSSFDNFVVWGHDQIPDTDDDFVKNVEEWISFAEAIHGTPPETNSSDGITSEGDKKR